MSDDRRPYAKTGCLCFIGHGEDDATTSVQDCPVHGTRGYTADAFSWTYPALTSSSKSPTCRNCGTRINTRSWIQCCGSPA